MSKHIPTKQQDLKPKRSPIITLNSSDTDASVPPDSTRFLDDNLKEGDGLIVTMGGGIPRSSPLRRRQALIAAANSGDVAAQSRLGDIYREGDKLTAQDNSEAFRWYRVAAEHGDPNAQNNLGSMYWNGLGAPKDAATAVRWYRIAAEQGLPTAQCNLAMALSDGTGIAENLAECVKWLRQAAEGGDVLAQTDMGVRLRFGQGVPKDIVAGAEFLITAARRGDIPAIGNLCDMEAELREAAIGGNPAAARCLKDMFRQGLGVPKNRKTSNRWGKLWATLENATASPTMEQVFTREGDLDLRYWDDLIERAPGDNLYSLEWWYHTRTASESVQDYLSRKAYVKYKAERDAGAPAPF